MSVMLLAEKGSWKSYANLAEHYKAIDQTDIWLNREEEGAPWHLATSIETGGLHRLSIPVSFSFEGRDPESGLNFRWSFDIERKEANGSGKFHIDLPRIRRVRDRLPERIRAKFVKLLSDTAKAVRKQGDEYRAIADEQYAVATELERL